MSGSRMIRSIVVALGLAGAFGSIGCQVDMAGMTLPSPRYLKDDVQYFPAGPQFKFANEEAALNENPAPGANR